jgi:hypothetical protein
VWLLCGALGRVASAQDLISISGAITTRVDGLPVPGAVVAVNGADVTATTEASGRYVLQVPRAAVRDGRIQLKVDALGLPPRIVDATVGEQAITMDVALDLNFTEQVTVGSRSRSGRRKPPVDILTAIDHVDRLHRPRR